MASGKRSLGALGQGGIENRWDVSRESGQSGLRDFKGSLVQDVLGDRGSRRTVRGPEGVLAGEHLVRHHPHREDIGPLVRRFSVDLLGG